MKRSVVLGMVFLLTLMSAAVTFANSPQEGFVPTWKVGDSWILEATYRDLKLGDDVWLPPIQWTFKVRSIKQKNGVECYVVHVFPRSRQVKNQAILWLAVSDLRPIRVIDVFPANAGMTHSERDLDPSAAQPLLANDTIVPYDLPVFPLKRADNAVQSADGFSAYRNQPVEKKFAKLSNVGGLSFKRVVAQKNKAPEKQYADSFAAYRSTGTTYQVEVGEERSGTKLMQLWQQGSPWAVSVESPERKVRLLPSAKSKSLSGNAQENGGEF